jgi:hypothetical protein
MADIREFKGPNAKHGEAGKMVDFDKAAAELGCTKVELTKNKMPQFIEWVAKQ